MARGDWPNQSPIQFRAATWRRKLGDAWPDAADTGRLTRQDVFGIADAHRRGAATSLQLLAAVGIWGYKSGGRGGARVRHWLEDRDAAKKLDAAIALVRSDDIHGSYGSLKRGAQNHIDGLGPAFFTKLIYFAAYARDQDRVQPLILDQFVAIGLTQRTQKQWPTTGWSPQQYFEYLAVARKLADDAGGPGEPDLIEFELFQAGKQQSRAHRRTSLVSSS